MNNTLLKADLRKTLVGRSRLFNPEDQLIVFLLWCRHYPTEALLEWVLGIPERSVGRYLNHTLQVLYNQLKDTIHMHDYE